MAGVGSCATPSAWRARPQWLMPWIGVLSLRPQHRHPPLPAPACPSTAPSPSACGMAPARLSPTTSGRAARRRAARLQLRASCGQTREPRSGGGKGRRRAGTRASCRPSEIAPSAEIASSRVPPVTPSPSCVCLCVRARGLSAPTASCRAPRVFGARRRRTAARVVSSRRAQTHHPRLISSRLQCERSRHCIEHMHGKGGAHQSGGWSDCISRLWGKWRDAGGHPGHRGTPGHTGAHRGAPRHTVARRSWGDPVHPDRSSRRGIRTRQSHLVREFTLRRAISHTPHDTHHSTQTHNACCMRPNT